ncbi:hypothetical protein [Streptomyces nigrescens]|uniref:hypothetical protein n=1 Tax=Streptomyces nigrescens TaxID=1920 RepID=UPI003F4CB813
MGEHFRRDGGQAPLQLAEPHPAAVLVENPQHVCGPPAEQQIYLNWLLSTEMQAANNDFGWPVRTDVPPAPGLKPIWEYDNAHLEGFAAFMADRAEVERWRQTLTLYVGEVHGAPSPTWLGLHPGDHH